MGDFEIERLLQTEDGKLDYYTEVLLIDILELVCDAMQRAGVSKEELAKRSWLKGSTKNPVMLLD